MISADSRLKTQAGYVSQMIRLQNLVADVLHVLGNYPKSLELRFENLKLAETQNDKLGLVGADMGISYEYHSMKDYLHVLSYGKLEDSILSRFNPTNKDDSIGKTFTEWSVKNQLADAYYNLRMPDSALVYAKQLTAPLSVMYRDTILNLYYSHATNKLLGDIYFAKGDTKTALSYYRPIINIGGGPLNAGVNEGMAKLFQKEGRTDSALIYAKRALTYYQTQKKEVQAWAGESPNYFIAEISPLIAQLYKANGQLDSAYKYLQLSVTLKDSLYNTDKIRQFQALTFNESARQQQQEQQRIEAQQQYETNLKMYGLITVIAGVLIFSFILYRNNRHKQKANNLLQTQKKEIETTLGELKATQKQLIQSEKMASLGELTAGIAHEIQNPLNFVNNFSELNTELIEEASQANEAGNPNEVKELLSTLKDNEEKINHHGKRADAIVKGMLQHSRASSGQKEPTDINALADEYLRLSYHGLRAKDKSFNAMMKTDFDESLSAGEAGIGKINIVPQDIGRVLLNLFTNAFYAVTEKAKNPQPLKGSNEYEPTITVSTKSVKPPSGGLGVLLTVKDNGNGIPQKVLDKIFQPFFTTKPTGEGTGLGLSLSYDIIKAHGGEIKCETKEGEGSEFIIQLPM
jgi:two-component system NtrC family sensor kinase